MHEARNSSLRLTNSPVQQTSCHCGLNPLSTPYVPQLNYLFNECKSDHLKDSKWFKQQLFQLLLCFEKFV